MRTASGSTSRCTARMVASSTAGACARTGANDAASTRAPPSALALTQLCIHFIEITLVDKHLARLSAGARRNQAFHFHHVHQTRSAAEPDAQPPLQVRNRRLPARHDDARGFVVE